MKRLDRYLFSPLHTTLLWIATLLAMLVVGCSSCGATPKAIEHEAFVRLSDCVAATGAAFASCVETRPAKQCIAPTVLALLVCTVSHPAVPMPSEPVAPTDSPVPPTTKIFYPVVTRRGVSATNDDVLLYSLPRSRAAPTIVVQSPS